MLRCVGKIHVVNDITPNSTIVYSRKVIRRVNKDEPESEGPKNQEIYVKSVRHQSQDGKEK